MMNYFLWNQQALNLYNLIIDDDTCSLNEIAEGNKKFHQCNNYCTIAFKFEKKNHKGLMNLLLDL